MSNSAVQFKVFFYNGPATEVRRFSVDSDVVTSFVFMKQKLIQTFPSIQNRDFKITWKDSEGDNILITSDEDFMTALTEMTNIPKVLHITLEGSSKPNYTGHPVSRVICDVCEKVITAYRYKCLECPDYDLCSECENAGHHSDHLVLRLPNNENSLSKLDRKFMFNAARYLKKFAASEAHRCGRSSKGERGRHSHHDGHHHCPEPEARQSAYQCPLGAEEPLTNLINQHVNPFLEMLSKNVRSNEGNTSGNAEAPQTPNLISDMVVNAIQSIFGTSPATTPATSAENQPQQQQSNTETRSSDTPATPPPTPAAEPMQQEPVSATSNDSNTKADSTRPEPMDQEKISTENAPDPGWTILGFTPDIPSSQRPTGNGSTQTVPPNPPQDIRLMRGLAQLHEMGFSNENNFLNFLLEANNYNVNEVVKAILELR